MGHDSSVSFINSLKAYIVWSAVERSWTWRLITSAKAIIILFRRVNVGELRALDGVFAKHIRFQNLESVHYWRQIPNLETRPDSKTFRGRESEHGIILSVDTPISSRQWTGDARRDGIESVLKHVACRLLDSRWERVAPLLLAICVIEPSSLSTKSTRRPCNWIPWSAVLHLADRRLFFRCEQILFAAFVFRLDGSRLFPLSTLFWVCLSRNRCNEGHGECVKYPIFF
jgi:hypothetical protein